MKSGTAAMPLMVSLLVGLGGVGGLGGCAAPTGGYEAYGARLAPAHFSSHRELISLPAPRGPITVAIYNFRDQTGQYKAVPNISSLSTAVTQGATAMLMTAAQESGWFIPVEREGLQNLLTERKIIRAGQNGKGDKTPPDIPSLRPSQLLLEGGIVGYETNVITGGAGAKYFGAGGSGEYQMDRVTVYLRAVDVLTGQVVLQTATSKTILSMKVDVGLFRYVSFKRLMEAEAGYSRNEPAQVAVLQAIEKAVSSLVIEGILKNVWQLHDPDDINHALIRTYRQEKQEALEEPAWHNTTPASTSSSS